MHSLVLILTLTIMRSSTLSEMSSALSLLACLLLGLLAIALLADLLHVDSTAAGRKFGTLRNQLHRLSSPFTKVRGISTRSQKKNKGTGVISAISGVALGIFLAVFYVLASGASSKK